jgi:hypothetical protein
MVMVALSDGAGAGVRSGVTEVGNRRVTGDHVALDRLRQLMIVILAENLCDV